MTRQSLHLFKLTQCETWICVDADILGEIEGGKFPSVPFKAQSLNLMLYFLDQLNEIG